MATAFISGITGMVGSHLADYLLEKTNWKIVGLIRWRSPLDNISHLMDLINNKQRLKLAIKMLTKGNPVTIKRTTKRKTDVFNIPITKDDVVKEVRDYLLFSEPRERMEL